MRITRPLAGLLALTAFASATGQTATDSSLARFYEQRWFRPAWIEANGLNPQARDLLDIVSQAEREGLDHGDYASPLLASLLHRYLLPDEAWRLDSTLTRLFFAYGWDISRGRVEPSRVDSAWTAAPHSIDVVGLLESALDAGAVAAALQGLSPPESGYVALRDALQRYRTIAEYGDWPASLRLRLATEGYDTTGGIRAAVQRFQTLHGLEADGIVGAETRAQLNVSARDRARQIALNLERWRWLPRSLGDRFILVNSAAFSLQLVENDAATFTARAIVGRPDWPTPILSATATDLVFRPPWRVPRTIAEQELWPIIQRDSTYLTREGFYVVGDSQLVQEPGPANPLGGVKLVFWNPFSVFVHDTPARQLFTERWRAFSHGCIRVEGAGALAAQLLPAWPADSIRAAMATGRERWVRLPQPIAVYLVYWTAWPTSDGLVAFAGDGYGWDDELTRALDAHRARQIAMNWEIFR